MFEKKCSQGGTHHNFQPRYDEAPNPQMDNLVRIRTQDGGAFRNLMIMEVYVKDVCQWCGKTIER